jgi:hypothetical protein
MTQRVKAHQEPTGNRCLCNAGPDLGSHEARSTTMTVTVAHLQPAIALLCGVLILTMPRLLNYIVAVYLILAGLLGLGLLR